MSLFSPELWLICILVGAVFVWRGVRLWSRWRLPLGCAGVAAGVGWFVVLNFVPITWNSGSQTLVFNLPVAATLILMGVIMVVWQRRIDKGRRTGLAIKAGIITGAILCVSYPFEIAGFFLWQRTRLRRNHAQDEGLRTMEFRGLNAQGHEEYLWLKDSSVIIKIPAGTFAMGSTEGEGKRGEQPQHKPYLNEYYIDKYEVTNGQYRKFCEATGRRRPTSPHFDGLQDYFDSYPFCPVVVVSWDDAQAYSAWAGKSLPTEAQWEKAARGCDARRYPWGNSEPTSGRNGNLADEALKRQFPRLSVAEGYDDGYANTAPVGSFPAGASYYGCLDMVGNVSEWCKDRHDERYYSTAAASDDDPQGPRSGAYRVSRGGSWKSLPIESRATCREGAWPLVRQNFRGFRCSVK